eukprot:CAMPEP_0114977622 /NCGR_PEP_ID=MMETSP0216-20121206/3342_1 /TAXON_ID=223996 /ORGANISM="Protocruzia adherens, Strain Boccale" /LENGTH=375 /DNA_ID=CAMNT_0002338705 /DNA_START=620 /DNA_END=1747 /DNA_ORIENTATION=+
MAEMLGLISALWNKLRIPTEDDVLDDRTLRLLFHLVGTNSQKGIINYVAKLDKPEERPLMFGFAASFSSLLGYKVDVVYSNQEKANHDYQLFQDLFDTLSVSERIRYIGRKQFTSVEITQKDFRFQAEVLLKKGLRPRIAEDNPRILLLEEVELLSAEEVSPQNFEDPVLGFDEQVVALVREVWDISGTKLPAQNLNPLVNSIREKYPGVELFIDEHVELMIEAAKAVRNFRKGQNLEKFSPGYIKQFKWLKKPVATSDTQSLGLCLSDEQLLCAILPHVDSKITTLSAVASSVETEALEVDLQTVTSSEGEQETIQVLVRVKPSELSRILKTKSSDRTSISFPEGRSIRVESLEIVNGNLNQPKEGYRKENKRR